VKDFLTMKASTLSQDDGALEQANARAKHLPLPLLKTDSPSLVPARMINELFYCERLMYLEWAQGEFADNAYTVDGRTVHRRADESKPLPEPSPTPSKPKDVRDADASAEGRDADSPTPSAEALPYTARSVWLSSERLGLTAKIDVVEGEGGRVVPIEYKRGGKPDVPEGAYLPERAQLCAQVLLLRDYGYECEEAAIYFAADRRRVPIAIDESLVAQTVDAIRRAREIVQAGVLPAPLVDSPKCNGCSLVGICLPDETNLLRALEGVETVEEPVEDVEAPVLDPDVAELFGPLEKDPWGLVGPEPAPIPAELRRLHPARDDKIPVYVQQQGARVALSGERLSIWSKDEGAVEARLGNTSQISLLGNVQITAQALRTVLERGIPVSFFTYGGWFVGRAVGHDSKNVELRLAQYAGAMDPATSLRLARGFVVSKILNCRTLLRRNNANASVIVLSELKQLSRKAGEAESLGELLGLEGTAARSYFSEFTGMLKPEDDETAVFDLDGRNRRPPRDPINALLSFTYSLLAKDFALTLSAVGLDPLLGFYHQPRFGRPALALDMMEEFRPLVADSVVIGVVNNGVVRGSDFVRSPAGTALKSAARRRLILAYERRMDQLTTHPTFGYRISYRRVLEVQARLLGRMLLGELKEYPAFRTR
jgi:CRISPR-associated protein Cas1